MKKIILIAIILQLIISCKDKKVNSQNNSKKAVNVNAEKQIDFIIATGKIEPESGIVNFSAPVSGIVKIIYKKDGDTVSKNEALLQLIDDDEQNKIKEIKSQIKTQQSQIIVEQTQVAEAKINLVNKNNSLNKAKRLVTSGAETQQTVDDILTEINVLKEEINRAVAKVSYAKSKLNELVAQLETAKTEAQKKVFKAPTNGKLLDINLEQGEAVTQFNEYAEFAPNGKLIVNAQVDELYSSNVKVGQQVEIFYRGSNKLIVKGEVFLVSPYLKKKSIFSEKTDDQEDRRIREIKIVLENYKDLIINSKVDCKIKL